MPASLKAVSSELLILALAAIKKVWIFIMNDITLNTILSCEFIIHVLSSISILFLIYLFFFIKKRKFQRITLPSVLVILIIIISMTIGRLMTARICE